MSEGWAIALTIIGSISIVVSGVLLVATIGVRKTVTRDLTELANEVQSYHMHNHAVSEMFQNVMEVGVQTEGKYNSVVSQVKEALRDQNMMLESEIRRLQQPGDSSQVM